MLSKIFSRLTLHKARTCNGAAIPKLSDHDPLIRRQSPAFRHSPPSPSRLRAKRKLSLFYSSVDMVLGTGDRILQSTGIKLLVPRSTLLCSKAPALLNQHPCCRDIKASDCVSATSSTLRTEHGLSTCSALGKGHAEDTRYGWRNRGLAPGDLESCLAEVASTALKGSTWDPEEQQRFLSAATAVGGMFLLVQSSLWAEGHPSAGQPALAVMHIVCCVVNQQDDPGSKSKKKRLLPPELLRQPVEAAPNQYFYLGAFVMDGSGWPTAKMYNSPSSFEVMTTRRQFKRPGSMNVVWEGEPRETLQRWCAHHLDNIGVKKTPATARYVVKQWYRELMESAGATVELKDDAPSMTSRVWAKMKSSGK